MRDRYEYLKKWKEDKIKTDPDYLKRASAKATAKRKEKLENDPSLVSAINLRASENRKKSRRRDPRVQLLADARKRAKVKGLEYNLTIDDIPLPDYCPVLGIKLEVGVGRRHDASPSIDRVNNSMGYIPDNVMIISLRANVLKNNGSLDELKRIVRYMEEHNDMVCN